MKAHHIFGKDRAPVGGDISRQELTGDDVEQQHLKSSTALNVKLPVISQLRILQAAPCPIACFTGATACHCVYNKP